MAGPHIMRRIMVGLLSVTALVSGCTSSMSASNTFSVRPVLCYAVPFSPPASAFGASGLPACGSTYQLTAPNLNVSTSTQQPAASMSPDPAFAHTPSTPTSQERLHNTVLLPGAIGVTVTRGTRLILGPAGVTEIDVQQASANYENGAGWWVNVTLTSAGSRAWNQLAQMQFHAYIAIVVNGVVISAPLMQPSQPRFSSFAGRMQIADNFTEQSAQTLVAELQP